MQAVIAHGCAPDNSPPSDLKTFQLVFSCRTARKSDVSLQTVTQRPYRGGDLGRPKTTRSSDLQTLTVRVPAGPLAPPSGMCSAAGRVCLTSLAASRLYEPYSLVQPA